jgi:hypothetical protein
LGDLEGSVTDLKTTALLLKELSMKRELDAEEKKIVSSIEKMIN